MDGMSPRQWAAWARKAPPELLERFQRDGEMAMERTRSCKIQVQLPENVQVSFLQENEDA